MFGISSFAQVPFASLAGTAFTASLAEDIGMADSNSQIFVFNQSFTESINAIADVINDAGVNYFGSATENIGLADLSTQVATFLQSLAENVNPNNSSGISTLYIFTIAENQTLADTPVIYFAATQARSEPINSIQDSNTQQSAFGQAITENIVLADIQSVVSQFIYSITENITLAEVQAIAAQFKSSITENMILADSSIAGLVVLFNVIENLNVTDSSVQASQFLQTIIENFNIADSSAQQSAFLQSRIEPFTVADLAGATGWFKINNDQTITWTPINNTQR
jgi:hypothetical protein